ncbi:DUF6283 family protein [Deinococcus sp. UR1]|uniref:DUF6283 family protein n=1 Tax=Deinococcus sp. UR1 TaxID=1704277 RepID=UPI000C1A5774|nr:DUF6283 family protein [Deinococcus sp. UR1]PIG96912.1 hypothetical protein AMD26_015415 [Deinococcus sp. UR1]
MTPRVTQIRPAGSNHQVVTLEGRTEDGPMRQPCPTCPWRVDATGEFPAEAFRHSAPTAYDMAQNVFSCHTAGTERPRTCAGFLLRGAAHNMAVRMSVLAGRLNLSEISDGGHQLHDSYRAMAEANGVHPNDPVLTPCR